MYQLFTFTLIHREQHLQALYSFINSQPLALLPIDLALILISLDRECLFS